MGFAADIEEAGSFGLPALASQLGVYERSVLDLGIAAAIRQEDRH